MPTTAIGICAYCACEKTGSAAPQQRSMLFTAAIAATRLIWDRKLVMPSVSVLMQILPLSLKSSAAGRMTFMRSR